VNGSAVAAADGVAPSADVVGRAQRGDVDAFESLYRANAAAVHRLCRRLCGDDDDPRELMQDAFVRAWERLPQFRGESSLATWLHRLTVNVFLERARRSKRDALRMVDADDLTLAARSPDPLTRIDIDDALARLPAGARLAFVLHDVEGYSHDEIAGMTGLAPGTARAQAWRARRALMKILEL
jgi:RNA polymerase sigma-70 factor (ECF subfamily)